MRARVVVIGRGDDSAELARSCLGRVSAWMLSAVDSELELLAGAAQPDVIVIDAHARDSEWTLAIAALRGDRTLGNVPIVVVVPPLLREIERFLRLPGVAVVSRAAARFELAARVRTALGSTLSPLPRAA
ncbi:MAG: hypothetical protein IT370_26980 [Deltaproteobacteria bacterium]|nr:hypothetical protein [Deltaproteobacteria bacterium]